MMQDYREFLSAGKKLGEFTILFIGNSGWKQSKAIERRIREEAGKGFIDAGNISLVSINTDTAKWNRDDSDIITFPLGPRVTQGQGTGVSPEKAIEAYQESEDDLKALLKGVKYCVPLWVYGKGTGTGAGPMISLLAKKMGVLPFPYAGMGSRRHNEVAYRLLKFINEQEKKLQGANIRVFQSLNEKTIDFHGEISMQDAWNKLVPDFEDGVVGLVRFLQQLNDSEMDCDLNDLRRILMAGSGYYLSKKVVLPPSFEKKHMPGIVELLLNNPYYRFGDTAGTIGVLSGRLWTAGTESDLWTELSNRLDPDQKNKHYQFITARVIRDSEKDQKYNEESCIYLIRSDYSKGNQKNVELPPVWWLNQPDEKVDERSQGSIEINSTKQLVEHSDKNQVSEPTVTINNNTEQKYSLFNLVTDSLLPAGALARALLMTDEPLQVLKQLPKDIEPEELKEAVEKLVSVEAEKLKIKLSESLQKLIFEPYIKQFPFPEKLEVKRFDGTMVDHMTRQTSKERLRAILTNTSNHQDSRDVAAKRLRFCDMFGDKLVILPTSNGNKHIEIKPENALSTVTKNDSNGNSAKSSEKALTEKPKNNGTNQTTTVVVEQAVISVVNEDLENNRERKSLLSGISGVVSSFKNRFSKT